MNRLTLRARMALLVLAGVLPLLAYNLGSIHAAFRQERARATRQATELARGIAFAVEGELRARIAALEVLALSRALAEGDLAAFRAQAEAVVARQPRGAHILVLREDGQQLMNTALPPDAPLPRQQDRATLRRVLATGQPAVSDAYAAPVLQRQIVSIEVPVGAVAGRRRLVLAMIPAPDAFDEIVRRQWPGDQWIVAIIDRTGLRLARLPDPVRFVGRPVADDLLQAWRAGGQEGVIEMRSPEGEPVLTTFSRMPEAGWGVAVAISMARLTAPAWQAATLSLLVGIGLLAAGLLLARWVSQSISGPIGALRHLAVQADGEASGPAGTGLRETDEVAAVLRTEAGRRRAATASLLRSERRLRLVVAELNHRAKNALATVQSLALQTARGPAAADPARFAEDFTTRLQSLARAHDLLVTFSWEHAALDAVVRAGLAPWLAGRDQARVVVRCLCTPAPPQAAPGQAQALVMALHELASNAARHGALSAPEGSVEVTCRSAEGGAAAVVEWRETGGPPVPGPPSRQGFGTRLLQRALARDLGPGGGVSLDFHPDGVRATIRFQRRDPAEAPPPAEA